MTKRNVIGKLAVALGVVAALAPEHASAAGSATITGIAFVDSSVTSQGSRAKLPQGAKIYASGTRITGADGCPTTRYGTDGLIVAVIDYDGPPTAGSLTVVRHPATGGNFTNAPYYLDINPGRTLQYLGPRFENGSYDLKLTWGLGQAQNLSVDASFSLARNCPPPH